MFADRVVVLGVTGGIAAYKSAELVRSLKKKGADVYCVMTQAAQEFITPLTLQTLSRNPVFTEMFGKPGLWNVEHIALAEKADLLLVAPATANFIGKLSQGLADDLLTTTVMACKKPVLIAPAMNTNMYTNPIVQGNLRKLESLGYHFAAPGSGELACGAVGAGRLAGLNEIMDRAEGLLATDKPLAGTHVLVTAGPTREMLDPVRYLTNYSTGKMGYALAKKASLLGAQVTLISGPTQLRPFHGVRLIKVQTAGQMYEAVMAHYERSQVIVKSAAVADFRPKETQRDKIKKQTADLTLELERTADILAELGAKKGGRLLIGFAAETRDVLDYAKEKIVKKNLDMIVANDLKLPGAGFAHDTNVVSLLFPDGSSKKLPIMTKEEVALEIWQEVIKLLKRSDVK